MSATATRALLLLLAMLLGRVALAAAPSGDTVPELVAVLKSDASQKAKADACRELARVGNRQAVAALAALLPDPQLSHMARYALEPIPSSAVDAALRAALPKLNGRPLIGVIGSVGVRHDRRAVPLLAKLLRNDDPEVAAAAARALGSIGTEAAAKSLGNSLTNANTAQQLALCEGLLRCAEGFAANGRQTAALRIYDRLRSMPEPHQVSTAAWRGAILVRGEAGLPLVLEGIGSDDFSRFASATRIARELPGSTVTKALARELPQLPTENQVVLLQLLGQRGDPVVVPALYAAAADHDPAVSVAALNAMASIATRPGLASTELSRPMLPVLEPLLFNLSPDVAQAAQNALAALPGRAVDTAVLAMLAPENRTSQRLKALELIARRRMTSAVPQLFTIARGSNPGIRVAAIKRLGELAEAPQLPDLLDLLMLARQPSDLEAAEQALAVVSQRAPDPERWAASLAGSWEPALPAQKCSLIHVFSALGGTNALHTVRLAATDPDPEVRAASLRALGGWNNGESSADLLELARSAKDDSERALALHSVLEVAVQSDLPATNRLELCRSAAPLVTSDEQKKLLLAALGTLHSPEALKLIRPMLDEPGLKDEACTAAVNVAEKILQGRNPSRSAAQVIEVLEKVGNLEPRPELRSRAESLLKDAQAKNHGT